SDPDSPDALRGDGCDRNFGFGDCADIRDRRGGLSLRLLGSGRESNRAGTGHDGWMLACLPVATGLTETRRRYTVDGFIRWESHRLQHHELLLAQPRQSFNRKGLGRLPTRRVFVRVSTSADADVAHQRTANVRCRACLEPLEL